MGSGGLFDDQKPDPPASEEPGSLEESFWRYHAENPAIYQAFCRFADEAIQAGRKRIGAKAIFERIRWWSQVEGRDSDGFKLNNNYHAFYARLWIRDHPTHRGMFQTRAQKVESTGLDGYGGEVP